MEVFIGVILPVGFNYAPRGWAFCNGQQMSIAQSSALFALLGTTFGGNGQTTFGLPDARGRTLVGAQAGQAGPGLPPIQPGEMAGVPNTTLNITQMPMHNHPATFTPTGGGAVTASLQAMTGAIGSQTGAPAAGSFLGVNYDPGATIEPTLYVPAGSSGTPVNLGGLTVSGGGGGGNVTVGVNGGSQPVSLMQPYTGINYIIALEGLFPSRN